MKNDLRGAPSKSESRKAIQCRLLMLLAKLLKYLWEKEISDRQTYNHLHFLKVAIESPRNKATKSSSLLSGAGS
jgi:hypothetical protein